jgi:hypothetical protein
MKTIAKDLQDFFHWLEHTKLVKRRTASVYSSSVRAILKKHEHPTQADLNAHFATLSGNLASAHRAAWKNYVQWSRTDQGVSLPDAPEAPASTNTKCRLPQDVAAALYFCVRRCKVRLSDVEKLVWGHVLKTRLPHRTFIKIDPDNPNTYAVPDECIAIFKDWAQPINGFTPLIPMQPSSQFPLPGPQLKRELLHYEKIRLTAERNGTPLAGFDPYVACQSFYFDNTDRRQPQEIPPPPEEHVVKQSEIPPGLDVPLSQGITTAALLEALGNPVQKKPFVLDIELFEKRGIDYPGDWRYLVDEPED